MTKLYPQQTLFAVSDRIATVVTDLNGLIGSIVNEEFTASDFDQNLSELFESVAEVEATVTALADIFYK